MLNPKGIVDGKDMRQLQGYSVTPGDAQLGYSVPNLLIEYVDAQLPCSGRTLARVNTNQNAVYMECSWTKWRRRRARTRSSFAAR